VTKKNKKPQDIVVMRRFNTRYGSGLFLKVLMILLACRAYVFIAPGCRLSLVRACYLGSVN